MLARQNSPVYINGRKIRMHSKLNKRRDNVLLTMCIPALIKLAVFAYMPMIGVYLAFVDYSPRLGLKSPFVKLENFEFFFKSGDAVRIIGTTVFTNFLFILVGTFVALLLSVLMNEVRSKIFLKFVQGVSFIPYFLSWLVVGYLFTAFLDNHGIISKAVSRIMGVGEYSFYASTDYWLGILTFAHLWKGVGVSAVIYLANIMGIDPEMYDAADLDGASWLQKVTHITLPNLLPMICVMTIMSIGNIVRSDFGLFFFLTKNSGPVMRSYEVIDTYVYKLTMESSASDAVQRSAAAGLLQSMTGMILVLVSNTVVRRINKESSLF